MANKNEYQKMSHRRAEERQLLAEQKWIIEALVKIKKQRNCLQIERLHLESLKAKCKPPRFNCSSTSIPASPQSQVQEDPIPSTSAVNIMQNVTVKSAGVQDFVGKILDDASCNHEELNLNVTNPVFDRNHHTDFNMEEDFEEESDDDMLIDMNMLMNGEFK